MTDYKMKVETGEYKIAPGNVDIHLKRGNESWAYIYLIAGLLISIEGTFISMSPLIWPCNAFLFLFIGFITFVTCVRNKWFQNKLIVMKISSEE
jgi:hypothetical protein